MEGRDWVGFAEETARGAGEILRRNWGRQQSVHFKGEINLVTDVDRESEAYIMGRIRSSFPDHGILSEESAEVAGTSVTDGALAFQSGGNATAPLRKNSPLMISAAGDLSARRSPPPIRR